MLIEDVKFGRGERVYYLYPFNNDSFIMVAKWRGTNGLLPSKIYLSSKRELTPDMALEYAKAVEKAAEIAKSLD